MSTAATVRLADVCLPLPADLSAETLRAARRGCRVELRELAHRRLRFRGLPLDVDPAALARLLKGARDDAPSDPDGLPSPPPARGSDPDAAVRQALADLSAAAGRLFAAVNAPVASRATVRFLAALRAPEAGPGIKGALGALVRNPDVRRAGVALARAVVAAATGTGDCAGLARGLTVCLAGPAPRPAVGTQAERDAAVAAMVRGINARRDGSRSADGPLSPAVAAMVAGANAYREERERERMLDRAAARAGARWR